MNMQQETHSQLIKQILIKTNTRHILFPLQQNGKTFFKENFWRWGSLLERLINEVLGEVWICATLQKVIWWVMSINGVKLFTSISLIILPMNLSEEDNQRHKQKYKYNVLVFVV